MMNSCRQRLFWACRLVLAVVAGSSLLANASSSSDDAQYANSPQYRDGRFANEVIIPKPAYWPILGRYLKGEGKDNSPDIDIPVVELGPIEIEKFPDDKLSVVRFGHSTSLVKINGQLWLFDPMFSRRASPFKFAGPKRFHSPPIKIDDLPPLDGVIISHNHYDHLDKASIRALRAKTKHFVVPLGVGRHLSSWGVKTSKITELDWWGSIQVSGVSIRATPAQHFSGRGLFDRNESLWASWVIQSADASLFYSGDSGYFSGFAEIGDRFGPFDVALLEVGAYDKMWPYVHMAPEQALNANQDLNSRALMPVHNGTFDLAFHPWYEPFNRMVELSQAAGVNLLTPRFGEVITLDRNPETTVETVRWWKK